MIQLTQLLAPTWEERQQADKALFACAVEHKDTIATLIQEQLQAMNDPHAFVRNVIAFWGTVAFKEYKQRMGEHCQQEAWEITFDYDTKIAFDEVKADAIQAYGFFFGVPTFIENLGFMGDEIEDVLLCCLAHPESVIFTAAEKAIGNSHLLSDAGFQTLWEEMSTSTSDWWSRRKDLAQHITVSRLDTLFEAILADKGRGKKATSAASLALGTLGELSGVCAKISYDFLEDNLSTKRKVGAQASFIHALTRLSKQFGFSAQSTAYCREHFIAGHHYERHDNDRLYSAYIDYLSSHDVHEHSDILQRVETPWALSTLCRNLSQKAQAADDVPVTVLQHAVSKSLGNYDGYDGMPHDDAIKLLQSRYEYADTCRDLIFAWWDMLCHKINAENNWNYSEELEDGAFLAKILKHKAQPMLEGLQKTLDYFIHDELDSDDLKSVQKKFTEHLKDKGYSETQIRERVSTKEQLINTFKEILQSDYGDFFEPIPDEDLPQYDEDAEYEDIYEPSPIIEKIWQAICMIE